MRAAILLMVFLSSSALARVSASYFSSQLGNYRQATTVLLQQAMQIAGVGVPELVWVMRQNGSKIRADVMERYLQGRGSPREPRVIEFSEALTQIINDSYAHDPQAKTEHVATLKAIIAEMSVAARIEIFVNSNKTPLMQKRLGHELVAGMERVRKIRARDIKDHPAPISKQQAPAPQTRSEQQAPAQQTSTANRSYQYVTLPDETHINGEDFLRLVDNYNNSSIALLHEASRIARITYHRLQTTMRREGVVIGKNSIGRILTGERIASNTRYMQLQRALEKTITAEMNAQEAKTTIAAISKIFDEIITKALPLERYVRDNIHMDVHPSLQPGFDKIIDHRTQAVADHSQYLAETRQAARVRHGALLRPVHIPSTTLTPAQIEEYQERLSSYDNSARQSLQQALEVANVHEDLTQLQSEDIEVEVFTGNVHVFRGFNIEPLQQFLQGDGSVSSPYVRELRKHLRQKLSSTADKEASTRRTELEHAINAALEALQQRASIAQQLRDQRQHDAD